MMRWLKSLFRPTKKLVLVTGGGLEQIPDNGVSVDFDNLTEGDLLWLAGEAGMENYQAMNRAALIQAFIDAPMPLDWWWPRLKIIFESREDNDGH